ncbi:MAG TPA: hypothetical protein VMX75_03815 [Spirochaetia bacterium]|nr:hypothetical protein [Spirochaetia bacterium]
MDRTISEEDFCSLIGRRIHDLVSLSVYISKDKRPVLCFTRPLVGRLLLAATNAEELLDVYRAKQNQRWFPLRQLVAPIKLFANVSYILQHVLNFMPTYRLLSIDQDFEAATTEAFNYTCSVLKSTVRALIRKARSLGIPVPEKAPAHARFSEVLAKGHLPYDRPSEKVASPEETVVYLATAFLNLAEESKFLHVIRDSPVDNYADWIPDPISEERLRDLEEKFHNLQSLYDTHISDSNVESLDENLPILRGHISVIYHLLETATAFTHYYERHIPDFSRQSGKRQVKIMNPVALMDVLMNYSLAFSSRYILRTRSLCHEMLHRYAIQGRIAVRVPRYRGFHVRPSTLIAKIVTHYGSRVEMNLEGETYNAGVTLDLFRANEKLIARKRRLIAEEVHSLSSCQGRAEKQDAHACIRRAIQSLFEQNKLVLYERNLHIDGLQPLDGETKAEFTIRALNQLLAMGKIDVEMETPVSFSGDRRVLEDIKLLAETGYGEDDFGNNLPLPEKLAYLRK